MGNHQISLRLFYSLIFLFIFTSLNHAQFFIFEKTPTDYSTIDFKFIHPVLSEDYWAYWGSRNQEFYSGSYDLDILVPISNSLSINATFPISIFKRTGTAGRVGFGCIGLGLQTRKQLSKIRKLNFSIGLFIPSSSTFSFSNFTSALNNIYEYQKYINNSLAIYFNNENRWDFSNGYILRVDAGGKVIFSTDNINNVDLLIHYGVGGGYAFGDFIALTEIAGTTYFTSEEISFLDRLYHDLLIGIHYEGSNIKPGIFYKFHFGKLVTDSFSGAFGFNIQFDFP